jgi:hypothetical protein
MADFYLASNAERTCLNAHVVEQQGKCAGHSIRFLKRATFFRPKYRCYRRRQGWCRCPPSSYSGGKCRITTWYNPLPRYMHCHVVNRTPTVHALPRGIMHSHGTCIATWCNTLPRYMNCHVGITHSHGTCIADVDRMPTAPFPTHACSISRARSRVLHFTPTCAPLASYPIAISANHLHVGPPL